MTARDLRIARKTRQEIVFQEPIFAANGTVTGLYEQAKSLAHRYNEVKRRSGGEQFLSAAKLHATGLLHVLYQSVVSRYLTEQDHDFFSRLSPQITRDHACKETLSFYAREFPSLLLTDQKPEDPVFTEEATRGFFIHQVLLENPALVKAAKPLVKPDGVTLPPAALSISTLMGAYTQNAARLGSDNDDLFSFLTAPAKAHPDSLSAQISYILRQWKDFIPDSLKEQLLRAVDFIQEEEKPRFAGGGPGPAQVLSYDLSQHEYEAYSTDQNWMPHVVMLAKSTLVWLDQLSRYYGYPIQTLDAIPDRELDLIAERGFTALWLIGLWERSNASKRIKNLCGNPEAEASAYSLKGYEIADSIGGWEALHHLDQRCKARGIRLASDMVPNHTGLDSEWALYHPEYFVRTSYPPFPSYTYYGEDLSPDPRIEVKIEDHYYDRSDAAVTYRRVDRERHETQYIFHGNDGTSMPWNDTAQLDFLNPKTREAVIQQILHVARNFHIIRFDAAMTLAKRHIQRLWYPQPGSGGDIPGRSEAGMSDAEFQERIPQEFWREVVDRIALEVPDTLLLAEAFWMMEGYFVRTLGMHRVYNSAFMNMLKNQENQKYRDTIRNTISFDPEILKRFVNFMNNPDEETAVAQFGTADKYFGVCTLLATMPGLPMFGHGQIEGFREKYGMEYRRAYWNEYPDEHLVGEHYRRIFPLLRMRYAFSGVDFFELFDVSDNGHVQESVFAYVNGTAERRALVLYNNQYEMAQGSLFTSAPKMIRHSDGSRSTRTIPLGDSLGLTMGGRQYTIYERFPESLTYIVPSLNIFDEGLWVSLNGYETRIYLNIREVEDHDGSYEALYQHLNGRGTSSFERDLALIRLQPIFQALDNFRGDNMLSTVRRIVLGEKLKSKDIRKFILLAGEGYARLSTRYETLDYASRAAIPSIREEIDPKQVLRELQNLMNCFDESVSGKLFLDGARIMDELPLLLMASLMLKAFLPQDTALHEAGAVAQSLLLPAFFADIAAEINGDSEQLERMLRRSIFLTLNVKEISQELLNDDPSPKQILQQLLDSPEFCNAIGLNEYQQVRWYHKENFQDTIFLIFLGVCIHGGAEVIKVAEALLLSLLQGDMHSGYQVQKLLEQLN